MQAKNNQTSSPKTIMQAYRQAYHDVEQSSSPDAKIKAYAKVIEFCANTRSCRWKPNLKRNVLLYWAHNHIARAFYAQDRLGLAYKYWRKALYLTATNTQKLDVLEQMIKVCFDESEFAYVSANLSELAILEIMPEEKVRLNNLQQNILHLMKKAGN